MQVKNNVVSFDFDGTLDDHFDGTYVKHKKESRDMLKRLLRRGYDVHIVTRRFGPDNSSRGIMDEHLKVWKVADELGVPRDKVIFTAREWKYSTIEKIGACMHIDDDDKEMYWLHRHLPDVKRVWIDGPDWKHEIIKEIDTHNALEIWLSNENNVLKLGAVLIATLLFFLLFA